MSLSVTDCRKFVKDKKITDEELQKIIDELYKVSYEIIGNYFRSLENINDKAMMS